MDEERGASGVIHATRSLVVVCAVSTHHQRKTFAGCGGGRGRVGSRREENGNKRARGRKWQGGEIESRDGAHERARKGGRGEMNDRPPQPAEEGNLIEMAR